MAAFLPRGDGMIDDRRKETELLQEVTQKDLAANKGEGEGTGKAIKESEARYRALFEASPEAIFIAAMDTLRILDCNDAALEMFGYAREEMEGLSLYEMVPEEVRRQISEAKQHSIENHIFTESLGLRKDGSIFPTEVSASRTRIAGQTYNISFTRDITNRKRAEEALKKNESYFRSIIENTWDVVIVVDRNARVRSMSPSLERIFGLKPEDLMGREQGDFLRFIHPEDRDKFMSSIEDSLKNPGHFGPVELRSFHPEGYSRIVEMVANNLLDDPIIQGIIYTFRDITDRKQAEDALRENEETLRALLNGITDSALLLDPKGTIMIINKTAARRLGGNATELLGENVCNFLPAQIGAVRRARMQEVLDTGQGVSFKDSWDSKHIEHSIIPIFDKDNNVRLLAIFARDVTEHVRLEEELLRRTQELEAFGHTISHDLRNPLSLIHAYAMTAKEAIDDGSLEIQKEALDSVIEAARRMDRFIDSYLAYAATGTPEGMAGRVEPGEVIEELLAEYEATMESMGAQVEIRGELPPVKVDRLRFHQVMANLIDNALKFGRQNAKPRIEIGARREGARIVLYVRDNGIGIDSQFCSIIFEPFKKFSLSESPGLGIGLSTVRRAVTGWGGEVWMESVPGQGSTCYFTLPMADS